MNRQDAKDAKTATCFWRLGGLVFCVACATSSGTVVEPLNEPSALKPTETVDASLVAALLACEGKFMACPEAQWLVLLKEKPPGQLMPLGVVGTTSFRRTDGRVAKYADWNQVRDFIKSASPVHVIELEIDSKGDIVMGYPGSAEFDRSGRSTLTCGGSPITVRKAGVNGPAGWSEALPRGEPSAGHTSPGWITFDNFLRS